MSRTKQRVIAGIEEEPATGFAWVTDGYTIENYVPQDVLDRAVREAHPSTVKSEFAAQGRWENPLAESRIGLANPSKVAIARKVVQAGDPTWTYNLRARVNHIVALIESANANA